MSCNAQRTNPLDSENPDNTLFQIEGNVQTVSFPRKSISDVTVFWTVGNKFVTTSNDGSFAIETISKRNGWLVFNKDGYSTDSLYIEWGKEKIKLLSVFLNAQPQLDSSMFGSIVIQRWPNDQDYFIETVIKLSDNENDIDSVFFENVALGIYEYLKYNVVQNYWEKRIPMSNLKLTTLDKLIGKTVFFTAKDINGKEFKLGETNLKRIIRQEIQFRSPANNQEVSLPLNVKWQRYLPGFDLKLRIEIYRDSNPDELMLVKEGIEQNIISYSFDDELPADNYYWIIYCIDEFGNQGSSKAASFRIK